MRIIRTAIPDVLVFEPKVHGDDRGYFFESFNASKTPIAALDWVQDNESMSTKGVLRGLHYQVGSFAQAKLVRAVIGEIYDVAVDIRPDSATYGKWHGEILSADNKRQMLVPRGFAHGFLVLSDKAIFAYKCDNFYDRQSEGGILYNDPGLEIRWPELDAPFRLSEKDLNQPTFGSHRAYFE
ncbi:MAG: dTDP-4-dehydrorhamnose 3,5-epimerase [Bacteroidota bacterium]